MALKKSKQQPAKKPSASVISELQLLKRTWLELSTFWRSLGVITLIYAVLYFMFVMGLSISTNLQNQVDTTASRVNQVTSAIVGAVANTYSGTQSDATVLVQTMLFMIASLATVWALRKLQALKKITVRDAYYQGTAQLIPVLLVSMVLVFTLLPAVLGSSILGIALQAAGTTLEVTVASVIAAALLFASFYLFTMFWPAYYIASLPSTRPIQALRSAKSVTKSRRLAIMRKLFMLMLLVVAFLLAVLFAVGLLIPFIIPYLVYVLLFVIFLYTQVYLYELYRSLL